MFQEFLSCQGVSFDELFGASNPPASRSAPRPVFREEALQDLVLNDECDPPRPEKRVMVLVIRERKREDDKLERERVDSIKPPSTLAQ